MISNNMPSNRQIRFGEIIRSIISETISKDYIFSEKESLNTVTVSFVKMSKDLRNASVYIMPLGGNEKNEVLTIFNEHCYLFQKAISNAKLKSKFIPKVKFFLDNSFEEAERIEKLLLNKKVLRDLKDE